MFCFYFRSNIYITKFFWIKKEIYFFIWIFFKVLIPFIIFLYFKIKLYSDINRKLSSPLFIIHTWSYSVYSSLRPVCFVTLTHIYKLNLCTNVRRNLITTTWNECLEKYTWRQLQEQTNAWRINVFIQLIYCLLFTLTYGE